MARNADQDLIARIAARDSEALGLLYDRYGARIYTLGLRVAGSSAAAEVVVQEVFARCWYSPERFVNCDVAVQLTALAWKWARRLAGANGFLPAAETAGSNELSPILPAYSTEP